jgi:hypothetical protein
MSVIEVAGKIQSALTITKEQIPALDRVASLAPLHPAKLLTQRKPTLAWRSNFGVLNQQVVRN